MAEQTLIAHDDYAGPEPAIVLIHGLSCAASDWQAQVQHFKGRNRVVAVDLRGHGRSMPKDGAFDGNFDMPTAGQDVADLITALGIRSAIVAGHSMGCRAATEAALRLPKVIKGVALIDGSRFSTGDPDKAAAKMQAAIDANGYANLARGMFETMFVPGTDPAITEPIIERAVARPPQIASAFMCAMVAWDAGLFEERYAALAVPIAIVQSTHRNANGERIALLEDTNVEWHDALETLAGPLRITRVYGAGHFTQIDTPREVNDALESLL